MGKVGGKEIWRTSPILSVSQNMRASLGVSTAPWYSLLVLWTALSPGQGRSGNKTGNLPPVQLWSPQIAAACIQWERRDGVCFLHHSLNQNLVLDLLIFIFKKIFLLLQKWNISILENLENKDKFGK